MRTVVVEGLCGTMLAALLASTAHAQEVRTVTLEDGTVQTSVPVTEVRCVHEESANLKNAALGGAVAGGVGYATAKIVGSRNSGAWGLGAAALGALMGAGTGTKEGECVNKSVLIGHRLINVKNGKVTESFRPENPK